MLWKRVGYPWAELTQDLFSWPGMCRTEHHWWIFLQHTHVENRMSGHLKTAGYNIHCVSRVQLFTCSFYCLMSTKDVFYNTQVNTFTHFPFVATKSLSLVPLNSVFTNLNTQIWEIWPIKVIYWDLWFHEESSWNFPSIFVVEKGSTEQIKIMFFKLRKKGKISFLEAQIYLYTEKKKKKIVIVFSCKTGTIMFC